ncbi:MAG: FprA family A-type flavoprotein [Candidatus Acetothermia bacterium]|jgi:flavorubredoxin|nr:FprA family A-type flavoprotein [Candidatus Acetothermia bacterium]MDH7505266.1 FprA family A-type flavoprotein [Candidatus Acetothermia bacterium]
MSAIELAKGIFWVGVNDRETDLFESVWPLPQGVSYNSYLIVDEKVALIDTVKGPFALELVRNIEEVLDPGKLDYLVVNHMEPDHSGALPLIRRLAPNLKILGTEKARGLLKALYGIEEGFEPVWDGQKLSLGRHSLIFYETPFVHWPETMMTYLPEEKILFSGDAFGGFGALDGGLFDYELDLARYEPESLRYFSNIVGMYTNPTQRAIQRLKGLEIRTIAPSHGPVWRKDPSRIVGLYDRWSRMEGEPGVVLIYGSMYGDTELLAERVARGVIAKGAPLRVMDASRTHPSFLLAETWRYKALILGAPTYDGGVFVPIEQFLRLAQRKRLQHRLVGLFGSFGWSGGAVKAMRSIIEELKWELVGPVVEFNGRPTEAELEQGAALGRAVAERVLKGSE